MNQCTDFFSVKDLLQGTGSIDIEYYNRHVPVVAQGVGRLVKYRTNCWEASLKAQEGSQWDSTIRPSRPRSIALWDSSLRYWRDPPMWLGSAKNGICG